MERYFEWGRAPAPPEQPVYRCPVCGQQLGWRDEVYTVGLGDTVAGCSRCLHGREAMGWFCGP